MQLYVYKLSFIHILPINILTARWLHEPFHITPFSLAMGSFDDFAPHGFLSLVLSSCELDPSYKEFLCQSCSLSCWAFIDRFMSTDNISAFVRAVKWKLMGAFRRFFRPTAISTRVFLMSNGVDHKLDRFLVVTGTTRRIECLHTLETFPPDYMEGFMLTWNPFFAIFTFSSLWQHPVSSVYCRFN